MSLFNKIRSRKKFKKGPVKEQPKQEPAQADFYPQETPEQKAARIDAYEKEMLRKILDTKNNEGVTYPVEKNDYGF